MKIKWAAFAVCLLAMLAALFSCAFAEETAVVELPWQLESVEKQALYQASNVSRAILPEGVGRIEAQAFAYSGLKTVNLPESITFIAPDAFDGCIDLTAECAEGSYAYAYCQEKGIKTAVPPLEIHVLQGKAPRVEQAAFDNALANLSEKPDKPLRSSFYTAADAAVQTEQLAKILRRNADLVLIDLADKGQAESFAQRLAQAGIPFMFFNTEPAADVALANKTIFVGCKNGWKADKNELTVTCAGIAANYLRCGNWLEGLDYTCTDGWLVILNRLTGVRIGIDPGHQRKGNSAKEPVAPGSSTKKAKVSTGTYGRTTKTSEYVRTLQISKVLKQELEAQGAQVYMTRETHDVNISNIERAKMMNELGVDLVLRIHCDGSSVQSANGITLFVPKSGKVAANSYSAAKLILSAMISQTGAKNRGVKKSSDYTGLNWSTVPCILVECGFMTNPTEDKRLADPKYQQKLAAGMVEGIAKYMGR